MTDPPPSSALRLPVTVILPIRNEVATIREVLSAVLHQDYPELLEIIVADGRSEDGTQEVLRELASQDRRLRLVDNPKQIIPAGLNLAIRAARGDVIVRVDGHGVVPPNYVSECVRWLCQEQGIPPGYPSPIPSPLRGEGQGEVSPPSSTHLLSVGGAWDCVGQGWLGEAIARVTGSRFGVGNAQYRTCGTTKEPILTDTVPFWAVRRQVFEEIGLFREEMLCHEDYEFNYRLRQAGGKILLLPWLRARYYVRPTLTKLSRQYWNYGVWKGRFLRSQPASLKFRHLVPPLFVALLLVGVASAFVSGDGRVGLSLLAGTYLCFLLVATVSLSGVRSRGSQFGMREQPESGGQRTEERRQKTEGEGEDAGRRPESRKQKAGSGDSAHRSPFKVYRFLFRAPLFPFILATLHFSWGTGVWVGLLCGPVPGEPRRL